MQQDNSRGCDGEYAEAANSSVAAATFDAPLDMCSVVAMPGCSLLEALLGALLLLETRSAILDTTYM